MVNHQKLSALRKHIWRTTNLSDRVGSIDITISRKFNEIGGENTHLSKDTLQRLIEIAVTYKFLQIDNITKHRVSKHTMATKVLPFPEDFERIEKTFKAWFRKSQKIYDLVNLFLTQSQIEMHWYKIYDPDEYCDFIEYMANGDYEDLRGFAQTVLKFCDENPAMCKPKSGGGMK